LSCLEKIRPFPSNDLLSLPFASSRTVFSSFLRKDSSDSVNSNDIFFYLLRLFHFPGNDFSENDLFLKRFFENDLLLSIVVVVPLFFAFVLYPASKITIIIIINKCPYPLGPVSKVWIEILQSNALALPSAPANSDAVNLCRT